jgi:hypothetical protein
VHAGIALALFNTVELSVYYTAPRAGFEIPVTVLKYLVQTNIIIGVLLLKLCVGVTHALSVLQMIRVVKVYSPLNAIVRSTKEKAYYRYASPT